MAAHRGSGPHHSSKPHGSAQTRENLRFIESYTHNGRIGVLVELGVDYSSTTRAREFVWLAKDLAIHIAGAAPDSLDTLLQQPLKDSTASVAQHLSEASALLRDHIVVRRFVRWNTELDPDAAPVPPDSPAVAMRLRSVG